MTDITKKHKTRAGLSVRFLCDDGPDPHYPIVGIIEGSYYVTTWTHDGLKDKNKPMHGDNLVEVKEKIRIERWLNVYLYDDDRNDYVSIHATQLESIAMHENMHKTPKVKCLAQCLPFVWEGEEPS